MNTTLDLLSSVFIGGMVLLMAIQLNLFMSDASYGSDRELRTQQNIKTMAEILNSDLRKVGYGYDHTAMLVAESQRLKFLGDLEPPGEPGYGVVDTVEYFIEDSTHTPGTSNPDDIILVRVLNGTDSISGPSLGLVKLNFSYLDSVSNPTTDLSKIKYIKTQIWAEPTESENSFVTGIKDSTFAYWEFTIYPRNI